MTPYLNAKWPYFIARVAGGCFIGIVLMIAAIFSGQLWLLPVGAGAILSTAIFFALATRHMRMRLAHVQTADAVWPLLGIKRYDSFVYVECGQRNGAIAISKKLERGSVLIVDVYNPQQMPQPVTARTRSVAYANTLLPLNDPRTIWREGEIGRLPLRSESVRAVVLEQTLSQLAQHGDRHLLLREIYRVLEPNGRLVVVETHQKETWPIMLKERGFEVGEEKPINSLLHLVTATKAAPEAYQLRLPI